MILGIALIVCVLTKMMLRGGWSAGSGRAMAIDASPTAIIMGLLAVAAAVVLIGPHTGLALILVIMIHEYGHVAAFRIAGHRDATFRLVPLLGGVAISKSKPKTQLLDFYISLMGPAICIAPTLVAYLIVPHAAKVSLDLAQFLFAFAAVSGAINFFNLLPLWPLDGGRCARSLILVYAPNWAHRVTVFMAVLFILLGIVSQSMILIFFAMMALPSALQPINYAQQNPLPRKHAFLALLCYLSCLAFFGVAGAVYLISWFI